MSDDQRGRAALLLCDARGHGGFRPCSLCMMQIDACFKTEASSPAPTQDSEILDVIDQPSAMTVAELRDLLAQHPGDAEVRISRPVWSWPFWTLTWPVRVVVSPFRRGRLREVLMGKPSPASLVIVQPGVPRRDSE